MRPGRSSAACSGPTGLVDTGTAMARQLGFYLFVFYPESRVCRPGMAGWLLMVISLDGINVPFVAGLSEPHRALGSAAALGLLECRAMGLAMAANWWVPRQPSAEVRLLRGDRLLSRDVHLRELPYSALPASSRPTPLRNPAEHAASPASIPCRTQRPRARAPCWSAATIGLPQHGARLRMLESFWEPLGCVGVCAGFRAIAADPPAIRD